MTSIVDQKPRVGRIHLLSFPSSFGVPTPLFASGLESFQSPMLMMAGSKAPLTLLKDLRVSSHQIPSFDRIPNTSIQKKPLLIYHSAFLTKTSASMIESHLKAVDSVEPQWRYTMYRSDTALSFGHQEHDKREQHIAFPLDLARGSLRLPRHS